MKARPSLSEALQILKKYAPHDEDVSYALQEYDSMKHSGQEFMAARFVIEIVQAFNLRKAA